jgi:hypothetical protein
MDGQGTRNSGAGSDESATVGSLRAMVVRHRRVPEESIAGKLVGSSDGEFDRVKTDQRGCSHRWFPGILYTDYKGK